MVITNDLVNLNEPSIKDNKSLDKSSGKNDEELNIHTIDNKEPERESKGIRFKVGSDHDDIVQKVEETKKKELNLK